VKRVIFTVFKYVHLCVYLLPSKFGMDTFTCFTVSWCFHCAQQSSSDGYCQTVTW